MLNRSGSYVGKGTEETVLATDEGEGANQVLDDVGLAACVFCYQDSIVGYLLQAEKTDKLDVV